jgi:hypothetical protein
MTQRDEDLELLAELLDRHADNLTDVEVEKFASMRFDLTAGLRGERFQQLTDAQRDWATAVRERVAPQYANLVSRGLVPRGREVPTPPVLRDLPKRPPPLPKPVGTVPRASKRRADEGCYAFVNGDCSCECCS